MPIDPNLESFINGQAAQVGGWGDSSQWGPIYQQAASQYGIPVQVLQGLVQTESADGTQEDSPAGAQGPTQFMPQTAAAEGVDNPYDPRQAIPATAKLLRQTLDSNGGDYTNALQQYIGGPDEKKWGPQTAAYPGKVLAAAGLTAEQAQEQEAAYQAAQKAQSAGVSQDDGSSNPLDDFINSQAQTLAPPAPSAAPAPTTSPGQGATSQNPQIAGQIQKLVTGIENGALGPDAPPPATPTSPGPAGVPTTDTFGQPNPATGTYPQAAGPASGPANPILGAVPYGPLQEVNRGLTLGASPYINAGVNAAAGAVLDGQPFGPTYNSILGQEQAAQRQYEQEHPIASTVANAAGVVGGAMAGGGVLGAGAKALGGAVADAVPGLAPAVEGAGNVLTGGAGAASKVAAHAIQGGVQGTLASGDNPDVPVWKQALLGATVGTGVGAAGRIAQGAKSLVVPGLSDVMQGLARTASSYGITLPTGLMAKGTAAGSMAGSDATPAVKQFTAAVSREMGLQPTESITSSTIQQAKQQAGQVLDDVAQRTGIRPDTSFWQGLATITQQAQRQLPANDPALGRIGKAIDQVVNEAMSGPISGQTYQAMTRSTGIIGTLQSASDGATRNYGSMLRSLLDDSLERSATASGNSADVQALQQARYHYKVASTLENAADATGASGVLNPRVVANLFDGYQGPMKDLSNVAKVLPSPDAEGMARVAGSTRPSTINHVAEGAGATLGGGAGAAIAGPLGAAVGAPAGAAAGRLLTGIPRAALNSPAYRNALLGQAPAGGLSGAGRLAGSALRQSLINPLLGSGQDGQ